MRDTAKTVVWQATWLPFILANLPHMVYSCPAFLR